MDLRKITSFASARFIHAEVCGIDTDKKLLKFTDSARPPMTYDILSINIGITPQLSFSAWSSPSSDTSRSTSIYPRNMNITPVKPIDGFARRWDEIIARVVDAASGQAATSPSPFDIVMVKLSAALQQNLCYQHFCFNILCHFFVSCPYPTCSLPSGGRWSRWRGTLHGRPRKAAQGSSETRCRLFFLALYYCESWTAYYGQPQQVREDKKYPV